MFVDNDNKPCKWSLTSLCVRCRLMQSHCRRRGLFDERKLSFMVDILTNHYVTYVYLVDHMSDTHSAVFTVCLLLAQNSHTCPS